MNMPASQKPPLALIAGPTASGKSALALKLAEAAGGTIVNADSAQVYRDLAIVSARPTAEEEARVPHALYGYRDGGEICSAADWAADARTVITAAHAAGRLPVLVGGTGLYIRTLIDGIAPVPDIDTGVRAAVRALSVAEAHEALGREDPEAAARIRSSDTTRTAREAYTRCLRAFETRSVESRMAVDAFNTALATACTAEKTAYHDAVVRRETATRATRATAEQSATEELNDALTNSRERFEMAMAPE